MFAKKKNEEAPESPAVLRSSASRTGLFNRARSYSSPLPLSESQIIELIDTGRCTGPDLLLVISPANRSFFPHGVPDKLCLDEAILSDNEAPPTPT